MPDKASYVHYHFSTKKHPTTNASYPVISNVQATTKGLITWTTDIASTSQVFYGFVPYLGFQTAQDATLVTSHSVQLANLVNGLYYFKVLSFYRDVVSISDLYTFISNVIPSLLMEDGTFITLEDGTKISLET